MLNTGKQKLPKTRDNSKKELIVWVAESYGFNAPQERLGELQLRTMEKRLGRTMELDPCPLNNPRYPENKLRGNCRDHSLSLVSMLRHQGIPARARRGFDMYFLPDHFEDQWVVEYWNVEQSRWILLVSQLDELQQNTLKIEFDVLDVPLDQYIVSGKARQMCRTSEQDPEKFGIFDMHELGFVRGNLICDAASLNKHDLGSNPFNVDWILIGIFVGFTFGIGWHAYLQPKIMPLGES